MTEITMPTAATMFAAAMQARDLAITEGKSLIADGQWHRCTATNKAGRNTDGSYKLCLDGPVPWGLYRNWTDGKDADYWRGEPSRTLTDAERAELERRIAQQRREHEKEAAEIAAQAAETAKDMWEAAKAAPPDHPYLQDKQIQPHDLRADNDGLLLVPMYTDGKLVNLQLIGGNGSKWFLKGGRAKGCCCQIAGELSPIVVAEGFATAATINESTGAYVIVAFNATNLTAVATFARQAMSNFDAAIWRPHKRAANESGLEHEQRPKLFDAKLIIAADDDWKSKGNPGIVAAIKAAQAARGLVAVPRFDGLRFRADKQTDFNDVAAACGTDAVAEQIAKAVPPARLVEEMLEANPHLAFEPGVRALLAAFKTDDRVWYEQLLAVLRKKKVRAGQLDREVKAAATAATPDAEESEGETELHPHWVVEPWPEPIETAELLQAVTEQINCYVATLGKRAIVPALWTLFTYVHDAATHSPILLATSPEPDSGKTTLLGVVGYLVRRGLLSVNISGPALFRSLDKWTPTFVVDEADTALANNDDLKEVVNSGWTRNQGVIRCHPETKEPFLFSSFAPKALGMKGKKLPDTTLSRAIVLELKRKQPGETVQDFDHLDHQEFEVLRRKAARWAADNAAALRKAQPETPTGFYNRTRQNWRLLLAIAELAGEDLAKEAREAAQAIEGASERSRASLGVTVLADIAALFKRQFPGFADKKDGMLSQEIVAALCEDEEKPWATFRRGKPLTQKQLANLLAEFGIRSGEVHPAHAKHGKGYARWQFQEAWDRYLQPETTTTYTNEETTTTDTNEETITATTTETTADDETTATTRFGKRKFRYDPDNSTAGDDDEN